LLQGRSAEAKRKFADEATQVACRCLGVGAEQVRIIFSDMPPENYAVAGVLSADKDKKTGS
jgi:4-oxalocrotonate tautomerase family enzyme